MDSTSLWATGTYELVLDFRGADDADVVATVFAMPAIASPDAEEDAPILAQQGYIIPELGTLKGAFAEGKNVIIPIGEDGLKPEDMEEQLGPQTAIRLLLLLFQAAQADFYGVDIDGHPWREPSEAAFPIMERTHDILAILKIRLYHM